MPMCDFKMHNVGAPLFDLALISDSSSASRSSAMSPSCMTFQPYDENRFATSSEQLSEVEPSIVIALSSKMQTSRSSFKCPAKDAASWLIPSMRQPSPARTNVL